MKISHPPFHPTSRLGVTTEDGRQDYGGTGPASAGIEYQQYVFY